jgi:hypothetical protein
MSAILNLVDQIEENGPLTPPKIRQVYKDRANQKRGYSWLPPMPRFVYVAEHSTITGEKIGSHLALRFVDMDADGAYDREVAACQLYILHKANVIKSPDNEDWRGKGHLIRNKIAVDDGLTVITIKEDGRHVVYLESGHPLVDKAIADLIALLEI